MPLETSPDTLPLTTGEHLAVRAWLNFAIFGKDRYNQGDRVVDKLLLSGVVNERRVLEMVHAERTALKGAGQRYDKYFADLVIDATGDESRPQRHDEDEEGEDA
jgi:hypothetical protein